VSSRWDIFIEGYPVILALRIAFSPASESRKSPSLIREDYRETRQNAGGTALTPNALKVPQNYDADDIT
jgi:hypothetical protein